MFSGQVWSENIYRQQIELATSQLSCSSKDLTFKVCYWFFLLGMLLVFHHVSTICSFSYEVQPHQITISELQWLLSTWNENAW